MAEHDVAALISMSAAMFAGAFLAGYAPLFFAVKEQRLRMVSIIGAGLLIGTALIVIIPEGIHMYYDAAAKLMEAPKHTHDEEVHQHARHLSEIDVIPHEEHAHEHHSDHWQMGAAMAAGYALMLVIDRISGNFGHAHFTSSMPLTTENGRDCHEAGRSQSAMLGLMVHAAVDGVALGATSYSGTGSTTFLVFMAIMLHKGPAAFGLTTYLMQNGETMRTTKQLLLFFSMAAPAGALFTYYGMTLGLFGYELKMLALIMLFSGGTFLFVAMSHILPEMLKTSGRLEWSELLMMVAALMSPVFMNIEHGH